MSEVLTEIRDGFIIVTINRPEAKNAMTKAAAEGIRAAMEQLDNDNSLNAGILTGAGGTFCSGMDLKGFLRGETPSVKGYGFGLLGNIVVGIVGALFAGFLFPRIGLGLGGGILGSIIAATLGAVILLFLIRLVKRA